MAEGRPLELGLYQALRTLGLEERLARLEGVASEFTPVKDSDAPHILGTYVGTTVAAALARLSPEERKVAANRVIDALSAIDENSGGLLRIGGIESEAIEELTELSTLEAQPRVRPKTPLTEPALLTNSRDEPNVGEQISAELGSADQVDVLMAFVKFAGINTIKEQLQQMVQRGAKLRVITTTYCGATERRALDLLVELGADVKVRYEKNSTRLHAKAWLFRRRTGFDTAYVGSSTCPSLQ